MKYLTLLFISLSFSSRLIGSPLDPATDRSIIDNFARTHNPLNLSTDELWHQSKVAHQSALERDPNNIDTLNLLSVSCLSTNDFDEAEIHANKILSLDNQNVVALSTLALVWKGRNNRDKEISFWKAALRIDPTYQPALTALAFMPN